jgi:2',3'-cyclic-nucleotide 2'-phosphodiesterase (5'-nucleotidase family)
MINMFNRESKRIIRPLSRRSLLTAAVILTLLAGCKTKMELNSSEKTLYRITTEQTVDSNILAYYRPYKLKLDSQMRRVVAISDTEIMKGRPEGPLNNLMADAMYSTARANNITFDVAYTSYAGLPVSLPKGDISLARVFELLPYENLLTTVKFKGSDMQLFLDHIAASGGDPLAGIRFKIEGKKAVDILVNGQPLDPGKGYIILTSDYIANGGLGGEIFNNATDRTPYEIKVRDALLIYLEKQSTAGKTLNPVNDGRIRVE